MTDQPTTEAGRAFKAWIGWHPIDGRDEWLVRIEAEARAALIDELVAALGGEAEVMRHHRETRADGWSSWTCVPVRDVVEVRAAVLRVLEGARHD